MRRRTLLRAGALAAAGSAGCLGRGEESAPTPTGLRDPPARVYRPAVSGGVRLVDVADAGPFRVAVLFARPSRFWEVVGRTTYERAVEPADSLHLMAVAWDRETGVRFPEVGLTVEVRRDGDLVAEEAVYAMLSQRLGFHYGDNVALPGDGRYEVAVSVGGLAVRRTGAFAGRFGDPASATVALDHSADAVADLPLRRLDDAGSRRPVEPARVDGLPAPAATSALPGRQLGAVSTSGAVLRANLLSGDDAARFVGGDGRGPATATPAADGADRYLAVVGRTPHLGLPLPAMGLRATVERGDEAVFEDVLTRTVDPALGYHYGAPTARIRPGDRLRFEVLTPPQVARHEGYETAFVEMLPATLTVRD